MFVLFATKPLNDGTQGFRFNFAGVKGLTRKRKHLKPWLQGQHDKMHDWCTLWQAYHLLLSASLTVTQSASFVTLQGNTMTKIDFNNIVVRHNGRTISIAQHWSRTSEGDFLNAQEIADIDELYHWMTMTLSGLMIQLMD